jgi:predicted  nucleic acid-binding Zn-ribbon protein
MRTSASRFRSIFEQLASGGRARSRRIGPMRQTSGCSRLRLIERRGSLVMAVMLLTLAAGVPAPEIRAQSSGAIAQDPSRLLVVDCLLPGQVRKLGGQMTYLSPRRPVKTTAVDCEIRGGEYVAYDRANYATSLAVWLPQAEAGDPQAQVYVGEIFEKGLGRAADHGVAAQWYEKAAVQNFPRGQMNLAYLYEQGLGVTRDPLKALNLYRQASGISDDSLTYVSEVVAVRSEMQGAIDDLTAQLESQNEEVGRLKAELESNQSRLSSQRVQLAQAQGSARALQQQVEALRAQSPVDPERVAQLKRLEAELASREQKLAADERAVASLEASTAEQRARLTQQMRDAAERDVAMRDQLAAAGESRDALQQQLLDTQRRLLDTEQQAASLRAELSRERAKVATEREALARQGASGASGEQERQRLAAQLAARDRELDERQATVAKLLEQQRSYTAELTRLRAQQSASGKSAGQAEAQVAVARADLTETQRRLAATEQQVAQLKSELAAERGRAAADRNQLARQSSVSSAEVQKQREQLAAELAARERKIAEQQARIASLEQQQKNYTAELSRANAARQTGNQSVQQQQAQLAAARSDLASAQRRLAETEQRVEDLTAQLEAERLAIAAERDQLSRRVAAAAGTQQAELNRLRQELATREAALAKQQTLIASLQSESKAYQGQIQRLQAMPIERVAMRNISEPAPMKAVGTPAVNLPKELKVGNYHALIIGNNKYQNLPSLETPVADARAVDEALRTRYGFKTKVLTNATRADILTAINDYKSVLKSDDSLLIYYAGHGELDKANLRGYWLPVNAQRDNTTEWISDQSITDLIAVLPARHVLIVADSCYSGAMTRSTGVGLISKGGDAAQVQRLVKLAKLPSRTVLTSGGEQPVLDAGGGGHSIFARVFLQILRDNDRVMEGSALYGALFDEVRKSAAKYKVNQEPRYSQIADAGHLNGEFLFIPRA